MKSLELLVRENPTKTCAEIMQMVQDEKDKHEKRVAKFHKKKLDFIEDINKNGGYYKGTFGLDQYFVYNLTDLKLVGDDVIGTVTTIFGFRNGVLNEGFSFKKEVRTYEEIENYGLSMYTRVTEKEFNEVNDYVDGAFAKFWGIIDPKS